MSTLGSTMMSYHLRIEDRSRRAGRFISRAHKVIQRAFGDSGLKQRELADILEVDRSAINRQLTGQSNLTLRSVADIAWALGCIPELHFKKISEQANECVMTPELVEAPKVTVLSSEAKIISTNPQSMNQYLVREVPSDA